MTGLQKLISLCAVFCMASAQVVAAELTVGEQGFLKTLGRDCPVVRIWPDGTGPDEPKNIGDEKFTTTWKGQTDRALISNVTNPSFIVVSPVGKKHSGAAIVLCPGGGYGGLHTDTISETAKYMNDRGVTVVLLKYRVPKRNNGFAKNHHALQDAQRALGILRARAKEWKINPDKIGIGGFSAGGHLAASLASNYAKRNYKSVDDFDNTSCKPNFSVLLYPAYLTDPISLRTIDTSLHADKLSVETTPPTFIGITMPDKFTVGSVQYSLELARAKVPAELHVYATGGHGGAIHKYPFGEWAGEWFRWMGDIGVLPSKPNKRPFRYKSTSLPAIPPLKQITPIDQTVRMIFGKNYPILPVWPTGTGPDEPKELGIEVVTTKSRKGTALNVTNVSQPTLTVVSPPKNKQTGRAVIVCPGGGYSALAAEHEGTRVCKWLVQQGITAVLLKYRVPRRGGEFPKHHHALQDLQRSIRILRANAKTFQIDPEDIGVLGFSAGGHLCTALCTNFKTDSYKPIDEIDEQPSRPDFGILIYPAYLTDPIDSDKLDPLTTKSLDKKSTPPLFMAVARDDRFSRGMLNYYLAVREASVPAECHVYSSGGHGGGMDPSFYPTSQWVKACSRWLKDLGQE